MVAKLTLDKAGRIVLPKAVRDALRVGAGDQLELESSEDCITLRPLRSTAPLHKKSGVWVFRTDEPLSAATVRETLDRVRGERDAGALGSEL